MQCYATLPLNVEASIARWLLPTQSDKTSGAGLLISVYLIHRQNAL